MADFKDERTGALYTWRLETQRHGGYTDILNERGEYVAEYRTPDQAVVMQAAPAMALLLKDLGHVLEGVAIPYPLCKKLAEINRILNLVDLAK